MPTYSYDPPSGDDPLVTLRLTRQERDQWKAAARGRGLPLSQLIRESVRHTIAISGAVEERHEAVEVERRAA